MTPPSTLGWLALVLLVGFGVYGIVFWIVRDRGASPEALAAAASRIRAEHRPRDRIRIVPAYATRIYTYLDDLDPLAVDDPLAEDLATTERLWLVGIHDAYEDPSSRLAAAGYRRIIGETFEAVRLELWELEPTHVALYDFVARLEDAEVWHEKAGTRTPCGTRKKSPDGTYRWECPYDQEWFYVGPEWHRMGDTLRWCLWAHPPNEGRLVIRYPGVPTRGQLCGRGGHTLNGAKHARASVELDVMIEPGGSQQLSFPLSDAYRPFMVATATSGTATVSFAVSTADAGVNHFCFSAQMRAPVTTSRDTDPR